MKILCIIAFACCIVGAVGCVLGMSLLAAVKDFPVGEGKTVTDLIAEQGLTLNSAYVAMAVGIITCATSGFLSYYIFNHCKEVLKEGTPFTRPLLKKLRRVAVVSIIVNLGSSVLCGMAIGIAKAIDKTIGRIDYHGFYSIGGALFLLVLSLFIEYVVEKEEQTKQIEAEPFEEIEEPKE